VKVYGLTQLGRKVVSSRSNGSVEMKILQFLAENKTGLDSELEVLGGERWLMRRLVKEGLVKELTT